MSKEIDDYYALNPCKFSILKSLEVKQTGPYFNEMSVYLILIACDFADITKGIGDPAKELHLYFDKVQEFCFEQPVSSNVVQFVLDVMEKDERGLYRVADRIIDEQDYKQFPIGLYCSFFAATVVEVSASL